MVHGEAWTLKEFFTYPNEYIYWTIQIVMYPFMTGLVAGAFVQHIEPGAIRAHDVMPDDAQPYARMPERAVAAVAGHDPLVDVDDLGGSGRRGGGDVRHAIL